MKKSYGSWCILLSLLETFVHLFCQDDKGKQILNVQFFWMIELCVFFPECACCVVLSLLCRFSCRCEVGRSRHDVDKCSGNRCFSHTSCADISVTLNAVVSSSLSYCTYQNMLDPGVSLITFFKELHGGHILFSLKVCSRAMLFAGSES